MKNNIIVLSSYVYKNIFQRLCRSIVCFSLICRAIERHLFLIFGASIHYCLRLYLKLIHALLLTYLVMLSCFNFHISLWYMNPTMMQFHVKE